MPSKTFVPAFKAHVGAWDYYLCLMSYAQVAREINFAYELGVNKDLGSMVQRGIGVRTDEIREYLLTNERRFLGALVVAAWGGQPEYLPLRMEETEDQGMLAGVDREFGVLTFDGTHQFFALDGQHRLRAIKDAIKKNPDLGTEDIGVIVVPHFDDESGRQITRRLFTNINRNAVRTTVQENIALDEDDGFAITARRLLDDHSFIGKEGVVQVFSKRGDDGLLKLATRQVPVSGNSWTTIGVLYDLCKTLGFDLDGTMHKLSQRATDAVLETSYKILSERFDELLSFCGDLPGRYSAAPSGKELRAPKGHEGDGHPFMRPVVQIAVTRVVRHVIEQRQLTWDGALERLSALDWRMAASPFEVVWQATPGGRTEGKMLSGKNGSEALYSLLLAHVAPPNKSQVDRALKAFREFRGKKYPVAAGDLYSGVVAVNTLSGIMPVESEVEDEILSNLAEPAAVSEIEEVAAESEDEVEDSELKTD